MSLSVIVLNWNGREHLEPCFTALAAQTLPGFETILVDNASRDGSAAFVKEHFPWVRVIELTQNRGFCGGNIVGFAAATGQAVVLLNNDTAPEPGWLAALAVAAEANPKRGAVASLILDWSGKLIDSAGDGMRVTGFGYKRFHGLPRAAAPVSGSTFSACGCAVLYKRAMLDEVGFLDERFFMNGEDTDLCFRARLVGWEVWYCAEARVRHRVSASQGIYSAASVYFHERNRIWSLAKCMPASLLWKYAWVQLVDQGARCFFYAWRGCLFSWLRGVLAGLAGIASYRAERRRIRLSRKVGLKQIERYFVYPRQLGGRDTDSPKL